MTDDNSSLMEYDDFHKQDEALFDVFYGDLAALRHLHAANNDRDSFSTLMKLDISYVSALDDISEGDEQELDLSTSSPDLRQQIVPDTTVNSNVFFLLTLHKLHQKSLYRTTMHTFLYWKAISRHNASSVVSTGLGEQTADTVWTQDLPAIRLKADIYISNTQLSTVMNEKLQIGFNKLFYAIEKGQKQYNQFMGFKQWKEDHLWQKQELVKSPQHLRLLTTMPHVSTLYCEKLY